MHLDDESKVANFKRRATIKDPVAFFQGKNKHRDRGLSILPMSGNKIIKQEIIEEESSESRDS